MVVWVVNPVSRIMRIHRTVTELSETETLTGESELTGSIPVSAVFPGRPCS